MKAIAKAHPNIALVKYWGKRDTKLNLPAVGSISLTLKEIHTISSVEYNDEINKDSLILNNKKAPEYQRERVSKFLDIIRHRAGIHLNAKIISENNFPTGAGLASSASAFASLALAGSLAAGLNLSHTELSELARRGSGSAARSVYGGFAEMKTGERDDGSDAVAVQISDTNYWDVRLLIAITSEEEKEIGSTEGMTHTAKSSPFFGPWITSSKDDIAKMRKAIQFKNFEKLGEIAEYNCLKMHAVMMSSNPGLLYWNDTTIRLIHKIRGMRKKGLKSYFTIDAGPQIKVICLPGDVKKIRTALEETAGVKRVISTSPGEGVTRLEDFY